LLLPGESFAADSYLYGVSVDGLVFVALPLILIADMEKWLLDMVFIKDKQENSIAREKLSEFCLNFH